ncbi:type II secretion system protein N [Amphiplicatus metriothermophilus]|uniref:Type II secretion system protein N n=1 Tax=Amphiplicatus metriothermophilus TaxID=1519374 RepID=A0A239PP67_9PROT|nr:type II secretion system protein N [Amphiplicatus metriothermophilus]MBB5518751.1 hypothetical protein [Amphiplicatus metriothermophilus]SNT72094.1 general secretion pathway protein N [Amphiplicatus metriothermophilus]
MDRAPLKPARPLVFLAAAAFAISVLANLPASLVPVLAGFDRYDVAWRKAEGSLWRGRIEGVVYRGAPLGAVSFRVRPLSLLSGGLAAELDFRGGALEGATRASVGLGGRIAFEGADLVFDLGAARRYLFLGAPLEGSARIALDKLVLTRRGCLAARGDLSTDVLARRARRMGGEGFVLAGTAVCENHELVLDLSGRGAEGAASLVMRVRPDYTYALEAAVEPARADLGLALETFGFAREDGVLTYGSTGAILTAGT